MPRFASCGFHALASAVLALIVSVAGAQATGAEVDGKRPPNIVFIMADDLGFGDLGCYGQTKIRTPSVDKLAAEGLRFTQHYSGSAVCAPSRCVLMTGKHGGHAHIRNNSEVKPEGQRPIPDSALTIAEILKQRGYATGAMGKWGLGYPGSEGDPNRQGFDLFFGYNCQREAHNFYPTFLRRNDQVVPLEGNTRGLTGKHFSHDLIEQEALQFVRQNKDRPFFLYLPFTIPHLALQVPEDSLSEYLGKWEDPPYTGGRGYLPHPHPRAAYAAMITRMDRSVGRVMSLVQELGLDENTIVFFTSDNGPAYDKLGGTDTEFFQSCGSLRGRKGSLYEGGIRAPLVVRWPGKIAAGRTSDLVSAFYDHLPTLCEIAGAEMPADIDGLSLLPTLLDRGEQPRHEFLYWEFPAYGGQQALRLGDFKGVRQNMNKGRLEIELYNLAEDPDEQQNLAAKHPQVVERIASLMAEAHVPSDLFPLKPLDK